MDVDVIFTLPALIVSTRSCLLPRINEEPVSACVVILRFSSELAAIFALSPVQGISIVPIIVVVLVVID